MFWGVWIGGEVVANVLDDIRVLFRDIFTLREHFDFGAEEHEFRAIAGNDRFKVIVANEMGVAFVLGYGVSQPSNDVRTLGVIDPIGPFVGVVLVIVKLFASIEVANVSGPRGTRTV